MKSCNSFFYANCAFSVSFLFNEVLQDPEVVEAYFNEALKGDPKVFILALKQIVESRMPCYT